MTLTTRKPPARTGPVRPFVVLNMAMTADGKIATANRVVDSFGSRRDHAHLLELRGTADAVLCGAATAGLPGVDLGPGGAEYERRRRRRGLDRPHLRVVVSGRARLRTDAGVLRAPGAPTIVLVSRAADGARRRVLERAGAEVRVFGLRTVDLRSALAWLYQAKGVRRLICEGGAELNDAMFRADLVDEIRLTVCPLVFGGRLAPTIADGIGAGRLCEATCFRLTRVRRIGDELFLTYRRATDP